MQASCSIQPREANSPDPIIPNECMARSHETPSAQPGEQAEGSPEQVAAGTGSWSREAGAEEGWPGCSRTLPAPHSPAARLPGRALSRALVLELLWERRLTSLGLILLKSCYFPSVLCCDICVTAMSALCLFHFPQG